MRFPKLVWAILRIGVMAPLPSILTGLKVKSIIKRELVGFSSIQNGYTKQIRLGVRGERVGVHTVIFFGL
jgi:hypothetical protein